MNLSAEAAEEDVAHAQAIAMDMLRGHDPAALAPRIAELRALLTGHSNEENFNLLAIGVALLMADSGNVLQRRLCIALGTLLSGHLMAHRNGGTFMSLHPSMQPRGPDESLAFMPPEGSA